MKRGYRGFVLYAILVLGVVGIWYFLSETDITSDTYTYHQYQTDLEADKVYSVIIEQNAETPTGTLIVTLKDDADRHEIIVSDVNQEQEYLKQNDFYNYLLKNIPKASWLSTWLPYLIIFGAMFILFIIMNNINQSAGGGGGPKMMNFGKSRARMYTDEAKSVNFSKVAGLKEEKEELEEIVDFLREPGKYTKLGARIPKGVLLVGPPGTGKTLLAKAVAGEAGVPFFSISGSDFVEMFVGVGASRVRDLFEDAKKNAPCIVFIDEIDAVARRRGTGMGGGHDEREQTLNQMLVEMDGFGVNEGIIVMAATNRVDILDPAIMRPGRFDRKVHVGRPDVGIGAEKKSRIISEKEKRITAFHEAGHAILFHVLPDVGPVYSVSIIPTGAGAAGYTMPLPEKDEMFNTKGRMLQEIVVDLGGRVAEEIIFDDITTGASQDIKQATAMAKAMVTKYGMSENLGLICYDEDDNEVFIGRDLAHTKGYGENVATLIDNEVKRIIDECYVKAREIIHQYEQVLHQCADLLLEKEKISREEFEALFSDKKEIPLMEG